MKNLLFSVAESDRIDEITYRYYSNMIINKDRNKGAKPMGKRDMKKRSRPGRRLLGITALLTAVLVQLTGTLTTITVQQTLYGKQKDGQTS